MIVWQYLPLKQEAVASSCTEREICMVGDEAKFMSNGLQRHEGKLVSLFLTKLLSQT